MTIASNLPAANDLVPVLLDWFDACRRDLPWRRHRTLYGTWIAEMMLQQTTVAAVVPYWERFLARFPDVAALARADEAEVLALWSGLGYYRRARLLHAAARRVMEDRAGGLPRDHAAWRALPGVGDYAGGAIASMGLGEAVPAVDANARRVLLRWVAADPRAAAAWGPARLRGLAADLVPADRPGDWNEALMELGATVCKAREPACGECPVAAWCSAGRAGAAHLVPPPPARTAALPVAVSMAVVRRGDALLLLPPARGPVAVACAAWGAPVRADLAGLHRGLWGLPSTAWFAAPADVAAWRRQAAAAWTAWTGSRRRGEVRDAGLVRHAITRYRLAVAVVTVAVDGAADAVELGGEGAVWSALPGPRPLSKLVRKVVARESHGSG